MWSCFFALSLLGSKGAGRVSGRRRNAMRLIQKKRLGVRSRFVEKLSTSARGHKGKLRCPCANASLTQEKLQETRMVLDIGVYACLTACMRLSLSNHIKQNVTCRATWCTAILKDSCALHQLYEGRHRYRTDDDSDGNLANNYMSDAYENVKLD